jgi:hypothetical protein
MIQHAVLKAETKRGQRASVGTATAIAHFRKTTVHRKLCGVVYPESVARKSRSQRWAACRRNSLHGRRLRQPCCDESRAQYRNKRHANCVIVFPVLKCQLSFRFRSCSNAQANCPKQRGRLRDTASKLNRFLTRGRDGRRRLGRCPRSSKLSSAKSR